NLNVELSWSPFEYVNGAWGNANAEEYLTLLEWQLQFDNFFIAADSSQDSLDEAEGKTIWAQLYYAALYQGVTAVAEIGDDLIWTASVDIPETNFAPAWPTTTFTGVGYVAFNFTDAIIDAATAKMANTSTSFWKQLKYAYSNSVSDAYKFQFSKYYNSSVFQKTTNAMIGLTMVVLVVGVTLFAIGFFTDDSSMLTVGVYILNVVALVAVTVYALNMFYTMYKVVHALVSVSAQLASQLAGKVSKFAAVGKLGLVLGLVGAWAMFVIQAFTTGFKNNFELHSALAYAIAATIVVLIFFILDKTIIGTIIVLLILIIDAILALFGESGIQAWLTETIASWLYDADYVISNFDSSDRLDMDITDLSLADTDGGFTSLNGLYYTMDVTNTLKYYSESSVSEARRTSVEYSLQPDDSDQHSGLSNNGMRDDWDSIGGRKVQFSSTVANAASVPLSAAGTGINKDLEGAIYLAEAYSIPYEGCWLAFGFEVDCTWYYVKGTNPISLGEYQVFDVLPPTLSEFYDLDRWNVGGAISFPHQLDNDGDGLLSIEDGGADP
ncbi:MAG: hypothetical protein GY943_25515, partial [Chloroflexi bacterium]|nr:hypothetical protein [Chloroflexota bacterium]